MAVLATPFFLQFVDNDGVPVKNGKVYTYAAGTTTPKVTFTDFTEAVAAPNPVPLDAAGRATIWINGAYKFVLADENDVVIRTTDNVVSFSTPATAAEPFSQTFSGDGTNKNFTLSESMGTDPLNIIVYVDNNDGKGYNVQLPNQYSLSDTSLVFGDAPAAGTNNIYVFAPSTLLSGAAASAQAAATSEANATASAVAAQNSEDLAEEWATKTDGLVEATDNSSKAYAVGGVGVTDTPGKGAAKEWSNKTTGTVDGSEYSSKAYAVGGTGKETDNAKYYKEQAEALYGDLSAVEQAVIDAQAAASDAEDEADRSQAWAEGTQPGGPGTKSSKEWADESEQFRDEAQMAVGAVRVTVNDTTPNVLNAKLVGGDIATTVENPGGNEQLKVETYPTFDVYSWARPYLVQNGKKTLQIKASTIIRLVVGSTPRWRKQDTDLTLNTESLLDTGSTLQAGKDYYLYLCDDGAGGTKFVTSLNSTFPSGYTADNSRKIGGFHTLCVNAGTISGHPLSGYLAGEILPASVWCLNHLPHSSPEGMVYDDSQNVWVDIYLQSGTGTNTKSLFGATVTDTRQYSEHMEDQFLVKKALLNDEEFASAMKGSNQQTNISGSASPVPKTAGGHSDTAGRRMISNIGVEEGCGFLWQWLASTSASGGSSWVTINGSKGNVYGPCYVLLAGGSWNDGTNCGSKSRNANNGRANALANLGGRGRSRPRSIL